MKISFIGTGLMGFPMAKNLLKKKLDVKVFSRTLEKSKPLKRLLMLQRLSVFKKKNNNLYLVVRQLMLRLKQMKKKCLK